MNGIRHGGGGDVSPAGQRPARLGEAVLVGHAHRGARARDDGKPRAGPRLDLVKLTTWAGAQLVIERPRRSPHRPPEETPVHAIEQPCAPLGVEREGRGAGRFDGSVLQPTSFAVARATMPSGTSAC